MPLSTTPSLKPPISWGPPPPSEDTEARSFHAKVSSGRLRAAVRNLAHGETGRVYQPDDPCSKTSRPVLEVLQDKHPAHRVPDLSDPAQFALEPYESTPEALPITASEEVLV